MDSNTDMDGGGREHHRWLQQAGSTTKGTVKHQLLGKDTEWSCEDGSYSFDDERALDWKEFLLHSRYDHDTITCVYCSGSLHIEHASAATCNRLLQSCQEPSVAANESSCEEKPFCECPPLLPPLRPISPLFKKHELWLIYGCR
jgi:hypothetical protein